MLKWKEISEHLTTVWGSLLPIINLSNNIKNKRYDSG